MSVEKRSLTGPHIPTTRPEERTLLGQANGAAWALSTALGHPRDFGQAAVLSFGWPEGAKGMGGLVRRLANGATHPVARR